MSFEVRGRCETPSYFFVYLRVSLLSTCLRSKPLLACGQRALRAYNDIGEWPFVQARQPFANIVKLLGSYLCPLTLGAFALLLRSLVEEIGIFFYLLLAMGPEVGDNREILAYFLSICEPFSFQLVAPRQTCMRKAVLLSQ